MQIISKAVFTRTGGFDPSYISTVSADVVDAALRRHVRCPTVLQTHIGAEENFPVVKLIVHCPVPGLDTDEIQSLD